MSYSEQCMTCKHFLGGGQCEAFPLRIPAEIFGGEFDHRQAYPGDEGIRWEQNPAMQPDPTLDTEETASASGE